MTKSDDPRAGPMQPDNGTSVGIGAAAAARSPAAERNKEPIARVLTRVLPAGGLVLEVASGTGQHVVHFARAMPHLDWLPTEQDEGLLQLLAARVEAERCGNIRPPLALDTRAWPWPVQHADALVCINMIHIAPWAAAEGLLRGAARVLPRDGVLYLYGPYRRHGRHTAPSNAAFDADLQARNPEWGVRDLEAVAKLGNESGLALQEVIAMPANNLSVVFVRRDPGS